MTKLIKSLLFLIITGSANAEYSDLHPLKTYGVDHRLAGKEIDTALSSAPVELTNEQAKSYFPNFNPRKERAFSNISSGTELQWYVVKLPYDKIFGFGFTKVGIFHEKFSAGMSHGSLLFKAAEELEFVPQEKNSKNLQPFKSSYLVGSFEGLRMRGVGFNAQSALMGDFIASWNFYTLQGTFAMAMGAQLMSEIAKEEKDFSNVRAWGSPLYYQESTFNTAEANQAFSQFMENALVKSYTLPYNLIYFTCNHALENVLDSANCKVPKIENEAENLISTVGYFYSNFFHLRLYNAGLATSPERPVSEQSELAPFIEQAIQKHENGQTYGRQGH